MHLGINRFTVYAEHAGRMKQVSKLLSTINFLIGMMDWNPGCELKSDNMAASAEGSKDDTTRSKFTRPSPPRVRLHFRAGIVLTLLSIYVLLSHPLVAKRQLDHMPSIFAHLFTVLINMVNLRWGGLAARALHFMSTNRQPRDYTPATYAEKTLIAAKALQGWYDRPFGLWNTTGWWNSANCLTILTDWASLAKADADSINIADIIATTYMNAQSRTVTAIKTLSATGEITSTYTYGPSSIAKRGYPEFLNDYYDDEGWWALALIRSWDVTKQKAYLDTAERIFRDMQNGTDNVCGGGIWWSKERKYKNAIANELYLSVAASLANRIEGSKEYYLQIAKDSWGWFKRSGMINSDNLINDGLNIRADGTCVNNGLQTWSYNQGVVLGGLVELRRATGDKTFLDEAVRISEAAIRRLKDENGTIREIDRCEPNCGNDGLQFKGIFVRNLKYLHDWAPKDLFKETITSNADSIWEKNRNVNNQFGISWSGPPEAGKGPTAGTHSSAMDVLVAALSL